MVMPSMAMPMTITNGCAVTNKSECVSVVWSKLATQAPKWAASAIPLADNKTHVRLVRYWLETSGVMVLS